MPEHLRHPTLADVRAACAMLPPPRPGAGARPETRPAAVLLALFEEHGEARIILTKRPETMPSHQGEVAFPGGKFEPGADADLRATALREAHEEIGLDPTRVELVAEGHELADLAWPRGREASLGGTVARIYDGRTLVRGRLRPSAGGRLLLRYQACDERRCLPEVEVALPVPGTA